LRGTMRTSAPSALAIATTVRSSGFAGAVSRRRMLAGCLPTSLARSALLRPCCSRNASSSLTIASICAPALASALLAGVLLPVCLSPARSLVAYPGLTAPMVGVWLLEHAKAAGAVRDDVATGEVLALIVGACHSKQDDLVCQRMVEIVCNGIRRPTAAT
jgi:hypothetical protein